MLRKFVSLAHGREFGYAYDTDQWTSKAPVHSSFRMFQTYGHDLVQHSGDWPVTPEYITDYLASLAFATVDDEELLQEISYKVGNRPNVKDIKFAASIVFKAGAKPRYYSLKESVLSSSPAKQYDKRFTVVEDWCDGSPKAIFRMLLPEYADGLHQYCYASAIRDWAFENDAWMELPGGFLKWTEDGHAARALRDAYEAVWLTTQAYATQDRAACTMRNYLRQLPRPEVVPDAGTEAVR